MAVSDEDKERLQRMREASLGSKFDPKVSELRKTLEDVDLTNIPIEDLKALTIPEFVQGVNFNDIDTSGSFYASDMNAIAPGALNIQDLKRKFSNQSLTLGKTADLVDTQSGTMIATGVLKDVNDIEDLVVNKTISQGTNLHMINRGEYINAEATSNKDIKSRFVEDV